MEAILLQLAIPSKHYITDDAFEVQKRDWFDEIERINDNLPPLTILLIVLAIVFTFFLYTIFFLGFLGEERVSRLKNRPKKWAKKTWWKMRYGDPSPLTVRTVPASNNAQPAPATDAVQGPPRGNNDGFEEVALTPPGEVHTAQAMPMSPVKRAEPLTDPAPSSTGEQVQSPPFLTIRKVELIPRTQKATPNTASQEQ